MTILTVAPTNSNTSSYQKGAILATSAKDQITIFADDQDNDLYWPRLLASSTPSHNEPMRRYSEAYLTMLASEDILRRDWDQPEEDEAWANL